MGRLWVRVLLIAGMVGACAVTGVGPALAANSAFAASGAHAATSPEPAARAAPAAESRLTPKAQALLLEERAEALYGYVLEGNVMKAQSEIDEISRLFLDASFQGLTSVEGVGALSGAIKDTKDALAAVQIDSDRLEAAAARLRFAADSLAHPKNPLWSQSYKPIVEDLRTMEKSASAGDLEGWNRAIDSMKSRYGHIRAGVVIARSPSAVNAFETWLGHAAGLASGGKRPEREQLLQAVSYGRDAVRVLFDKEKDEPALSLPLPPRRFGGWGWLAAAFIAASLIYAAYRKYRGEREEWRPL